MSLFKGLRYRRPSYSSPGEYLPSDPKVEAFLNAYEALCVEHQLSLTHEDGHGSFEVTEICDGDIAWVKAANDCRSDP